MKDIKDEIFRRDENDYEFNPHITENMSNEESLKYLYELMIEEYGQNEPEIAYDILREIIRRNTNPKKEIWILLAECAAFEGKFDEQKEALRRAETAEE